MIKKFEEYIKEHYLDEPSDPEILDFDFKKMKKNGFTEVTVKKDCDGVKKGEKVLVNAYEYGELLDDAIVVCYTKDGEKVMVQKFNLQIESKK